ncbi:hypothetical protein SNE40_019662 [Patella caerulea]|uniref:Uncharacterized protein n=1 Tax=Patella caerulea TaxID=87958 RepID=A0AAN8J6V1_PATCE
MKSDCWKENKKHEIDTYITPVNKALRRMPHAIRDQFKTKVDLMERQGVITTVCIDPMIYYYLVLHKLKYSQSMTCVMVSGIYLLKKIHAFSQPLVHLLECTDGRDFPLAYLNYYSTDLDGTFRVSDYIPVIGEGLTVNEAVKHHDQRFIQRLEQCRQMNVKLNPVKLDLKKNPGFLRWTYSDGLKPDPQKIKAILNMPKPINVQCAENHRDGS